MPDAVGGKGLAICGVLRELRIPERIAIPIVPRIRC